MKNALLDADVLDPDQRNVTLGAAEETLFCNQFAILDAVSESKITNDRQTYRQPQKNRGHPQVNIRFPAAAEEQHHDQRQNNIPNPIPEREEQSARMKPSLQCRPLDNRKLGWRDRQRGRSRWRQWW